MSNLIPKSLSKQKNVLYKSITWFDLLFVIIFIGIGVAMGFAIPGSIVIRIIVAISITLVLSCVLIPVNKNNERVYQFIIFFIKFIISNRKYSKSGLNQTKSLIPYTQLKEDALVVSKSNNRPTSYIRAVKINGNDITTLDYQEQLFIFSGLQQILKNLNCSFSLIKFDEPLVLENQAKYILKKIKELENDYMNLKIDEEFYESSKFQLYSQLENLYHPSNILEGISEYKSFYIFIYNKNFNQANEIINSLHQKLRSINIENEILDRYEIINAIKNIFNPLNENIANDIIDEKELKINDLFNFNNFDIHYNNIEINKKLFINISAVNDYPLDVDDYWLASIMINTSASMIWNVGPLSLTSAKSLINKAIVNAQADVMNTNKNVQKKELINLANSFEKLAENIASNDDQLKNTTMYFINYGLDKKSVQLELKKLRDTLNDKNIKLDDLKFKQLEAFKSAIPKIWVNDEIKHVREMPISTIAHGYPFLNNSLLDNGGLLLGYNSTKDSIVFNQFDLASDANRKNYNMLLLGTSGSGKSYSVKKMLNWHIMNNRKVIIIDPEREYKKLCEYYNGNWLDASNGNISRINPLQILNSINEVTDDQVSNNMQLIQNHIQFLEQFFSILYPEINDNQLRLLGVIIKDVYLDFKFDKKDVINLKPEEFPIIDDLIKKINKLPKTYLTRKNIDIADLSIIKNILNNDFSNGGKFETLYNGYSTIDLASNLITFDINELFEKGYQNLIQGQLFLILAIVSNIIKNNDNKKEVIVAIDEAHLLIDKDNQVALNFMFQMVKRIRKRNGGIILITQNPDDFLASEEIIKKTTAMINNTQYMMILNLSPKNIKDIEIMFKSYGNGLSESEKNFIARARRGQGLFIVSGFNRHMINIKHSKNEENAYKNVVRNDSTVLSKQEKIELLRKQTVEISKRLNNEINYLRNIAQTEVKKVVKKNELQRAIKKDNDKYISGLSED